MDINVNNVELHKLLNQQHEIYQEIKKQCRYARWQWSLNRVKHFFKNIYFYFRYPSLRGYHSIQINLSKVWDKVNFLEQYFKGRNMEV